MQGGRQAAVFGLTALRRRMLVSLELNNKDHAYEWFLKWMAHQKQKPPTSRIAAGLARSHELSVETAVEKRANGSAFITFNFVVGPGTHFVNYKGAWIQVSFQTHLQRSQVEAYCCRSKGNARHVLFKLSRLDKRLHGRP